MSPSSPGRDALFAAIVDDVRGQDHEQAFAEAERRSREWAARPGALSRLATAAVLVLATAAATGLGALVAPRLVGTDPGRAVVRLLGELEAPVAIGAGAIVAGAVVLFAIGSLVRWDR
jgi:hypothetical protein